MIDRDGNIYQFVRTADKAWHAKGANEDSVGIEFSSDGAPMTIQQEQMGIALLRFLMCQYMLSYDAIRLHKYESEPGHTICPAGLFGDQSFDTFDKWRKRHFEKDFPLSSLPTS